MQVELQTDASKIVLYDCTPSPIRTLGPGQRHDFLIKVVLSFVSYRFTHGCTYVLKMGNSSNYCSSTVLPCLHGRHWVVACES